MNVLDDLKNRGVFNNITNEEKFNNLKKGSGVYIGFDPTAPSLHLGNYIQIMNLRRMAQHGFKPFAVIGGATGMIGDPSGKSEERNLLDETTILINKNRIKAQLEKFNFVVVDNYDFYSSMSVLQFLRDVGKHMNISQMLARDIVKNRLEQGISFTEFSYQLIQGWDFKTLYENYDVAVQMGGSDQWGNIVSGVELIRKTIGEENHAVGITTNLLTTSSGKKFGKSEGNAIWMDANLTTPYALYQYLVNTPDEDVFKLLHWLTLLDQETIDKVADSHDLDKTMRIAQKIFAEEVVRDIHGEEQLQNALDISEVLFGTKNVDNLTTEALEQLAGAIPTFEKVTGKVKEVLQKINVVSSNRELREFIEQEAIEINGKVIKDENEEIDLTWKNGKYTFIKRGKKKFFLIIHKK